MSILNPEVLVSIDGSYMIYYALFGAFNKWKEDPLNQQLIENPDQQNLPRLTQYNSFINLYEEKLIHRFEVIYWIINKKIFKDLKFTNDPKVFLCLDSPLKNNWRMKVYDQYKQQRKTAVQQFHVRDAFSYGMNVLLNKIDINKYFGINVIKVDGAEGDDIIATINTKVPAEYKFIIASDKDYLQLSDNIRMFDLTGKEVVPEPYKDLPVTGKQYLLAKILTGDVSDNIPQVFTRCGYKTAMKLVLNPNELKFKLKTDLVALERFKINSKLIDFRYIPEQLTESIMSSLNIKNDNLEVI